MAHERFGTRPARGHGRNSEGLSSGTSLFLPDRRDHPLSMLNLCGHEERDMCCRH